MTEEDVEDEEELEDAAAVVPGRPSKPPEYPLRVVAALDAQRAVAPRVWIPGQWAAWFHESLLVYPCPECSMPPLSPCIGPEEDRPCVTEGGRCHSARGAMKSVSQPPFDGTRDFGLRNGDEMVARARGLLPYPPGTAYLGRFPAVVGDVVVRSREELDRLNADRPPRGPELAREPAAPVLETEPAKSRGGQATLGAWLS